MPPQKQKRQPRRQSRSISSTTNDNFVSNPNESAIATLCAEVKKLQQTVQLQGETIKSLVEKTVTNNTIASNVQESAVNNSNTVVSTDNTIQPGSSGLQSSMPQRISTSMFPHIQTVSPAIRKQIIEGKYINLASLLQPSDNNQDYKTINENDGSVILVKNKDPRLQRNLQLNEFIEAFNIYKNVVCELEPSRRVEMDMYAQDIINMATKFKGPVFYEYHKEFAKKAAAIKFSHGLTVDWSIRDEKLYSTISSGQAVIVCETCGSSVHSAHACPHSSYLPNQSLNRTWRAPSQTSQQRSAPMVNREPKTDIKGRPVLFYRGKEVCNNFLAGNCFRQRCALAHVDTKTLSGNESATTNAAKQPAKPNVK